MQPVAILILILVGVLIFAFMNDMIGPEGTETPSSSGGTSGGQKGGASSQTGGGTQLQYQTSGISIDTFVSFGPRPNEVISNTNQLTFEFGAKVSPENTQGQITYETRVVGLETNWQQTSATERTIDFPGGAKQYTFQVRAKINNTVDSTPAELTFTLNLSPYLEKVKISAVRPPGFLTSSLITLNTYLSQNETIDITGWKMVAGKGYFTVPQGIETYNPLSTTLPLKDIIIKQNDIIYISSEPNPLGGNFNFRLNKCMGYLKNSHTFPITMPSDCPQPQSDKIPLYLEKCCKEYILSLGTCEQPTHQGMESYGIFSDPNCYSYLNSTFNYSGCFANYYQTTGFSQNQWHIYLNNAEREIMDTQVDTIYLRDSNGLLVNTYSYGSVPCCQ